MTSFTPSYLVLCESGETGAGQDPVLFWKLKKHVSTATRKCHVSHQRNSGKAFQFLFTRSYNSISPSRLQTPAALRRSLFIYLLQLLFPSVTYIKKNYLRKYIKKGIHAARRSHGPRSEGSGERGSHVSPSRGTLRQRRVSQVFICPTQVLCGTNFATLCFVSGTF